MSRMNRFSLFIVFIFSIVFTSCTVKEKIVFNEDGTGNYLISYDMANAMKQMKGAFGESSTKTEKQSKVVDTLMVFSEIMEAYKDSVAELPEDKRLALEAVKDMYMKMKMDEENEVFDFGIGLNFNSIDDLKGIEKKIQKARSLTSQNSQIDAMKSGSPLGKFMGNDDNSVSYSYSKNSFARTTIFNNQDEGQEVAFDEADQEFIQYFENAAYIIEYTFPKKIKSYSLENAQLSDDKRTITFESNWLDFIKKPKSLDVVIKFEDE